ncbi:hypothetical protein BT63DRAFT_457199 [Microthyrium microscopicum]|uniref:Uncharacterized protein n=1 Tax=Microthyrium microscopicum TaxID=703497 RepID=A0A6A6U9U9_9PEZI|nr:hypothetical protein BT63DRAFT_457199 [Microthyrium microscopicum]
MDPAVELLRHPDPNESDGNDPRKRDSLILVIALDDGPLDTDSIISYYPPLLRMCRMLRAKKPEAAIRIITDDDPVIVFLADAYMREHEQLMDMLVGFVHAGGMLVCADKFAITINSVELKPFFSSFGLPWDMGACYRTAYVVNPACSHTPLSCHELTEKTNVKALLLENVAEGDKLYVPKEGARIQSVILSAMGQLGPVLENRSLTPTAFAKVGLGYVMYSGDVQGHEHATHMAILAACTKMHKFLGAAYDRQQ